MNRPEVLDKFTKQMRQKIIFPDMVREADRCIVRYTRPAPGRSLILYSDLTEANADNEIGAQIAELTTRGLPFDWKMYTYDTPIDLLDRLANHGFLPDPPDALMVLDLEASSVRFKSAPGQDLRPVHRENLGDVVQILQKVWGGSFDWVYERIGAHLEVPEYLSIYAAYVDNQPACVGWTYYPTGSEFASLWGGSTLAEHREKGLYTAILSMRVNEAVSRGRHYLTVDAGSMSRPIVEKYGFIYLTDIYACEYTGKLPPDKG